MFSWAYKTSSTPFISYGLNNKNIHDMYFLSKPFLQNIKHLHVLYFTWFLDLIIHILYQARKSNLFQRFNPTAPRYIKIPSLPWDDSIFWGLNIVSVMLSSKLIIMYAYSVFIFKVMHHVVHTDAGNSHLTLTSDNKYNVIYRYYHKCHSLFCHMTSNMA